ncbi:MAG: hypothetical protein V2A54_00245 [Bacteroidota bacterium]
MKKVLIFSAAALAMLFITSCGKWIAPPYTNVSKIITVKNGMGIEQVNAALGIEPYDVYHIQEDGSSVLVYNYRLKDRRMTVPIFYNAKERAIRGDESSQTQGNVWYGSAARLYVLLKDGKVKSMVTDAGREDAQYLLLTNNNIQTISKEELVTLSKQDNAVNYMFINSKEELKSLQLPGNNANANPKSIVIPTNVSGDAKKGGSFMQKKSRVSAKKIPCYILFPPFLVIDLLSKKR